LSFRYFTFSTGIYIRLYTSQRSIGLICLHVMQSISWVVFVVQTSEWGAKSGGLGTEVPSGVQRWSPSRCLGTPQKPKLFC